MQKSFQFMALNSSHTKICRFNANTIFGCGNRAENRNKTIIIICREQSRSTVIAWTKLADASNNNNFPPIDDRLLIASIYFIYFLLNFLFFFSSAYVPHFQTKSKSNFSILMSLRVASVFQLIELWIEFTSVYAENLSHYVDNFINNGLGMLALY